MNAHGAERIWRFLRGRQDRRTRRGAGVTRAQFAKRYLSMGNLCAALGSVLPQRRVTRCATPPPGLPLRLCVME